MKLGQTGSAMLLAAAASITLGQPASAQGLDLDILDIGKGFLTISEATAQVRMACFTPPEAGRSGIGSVPSVGDILNTGKGYNYANNLKRFPVCSIGANEPMVVAAGARLAKFSMVQITSALVEVELALGMKSDELMTFAEQLNATNESDIDYEQIGNFLNAETKKIEAFNKANKKLKLSPELQAQIAKAEARLKASYSYTGQAFGSALWAFDKLSKKSPQEKQALAVQSAAYGIKESYVMNLGEMSKGLIDSLSGTISAVSKIAKARSKDVPDDIFEAETTAAKSDVDKLIDRLRNGGGE